MTTATTEAGRLSAAEAAAIHFEPYPSEKAAIIMREASRWEEKTKRHGMLARMVACFVTTSDREIEERIRADENVADMIEAQIELLEWIKDVATFYEGVAETMRVAENRLIVVLSRFEDDETEGDAS